MHRAQHKADPACGWRTDLKLVVLRLVCADYFGSGPTGGYQLLPLAVIFCYGFGEALDCLNGGG